MERFYKSSTEFISLIVSCFIFSFLTSCDHGYQLKNEKKVEAPKLKCELKWIGHWKNEGDKANLVKEVAQEYEFLNQEIKVSLTWPEELYNCENGEAESQFIAEQVRKPVADWDIVRLYGNHDRIAFLLNDPNWAEKYMVDFGQIPGFFESHKSFLSKKQYRDRFNNHFWGPYNEGQVAALFVNLKVAEKLGIKIKQFDMTFDDFLSYIKAVGQYNHIHSDKIIPIFEYDWRKSSMIFKILFFSLLNDPDEAFSDKLTTNKLNAFEKTLEAMDQLAQLHPFEDKWHERVWVRHNNLILKDSCLFFPNFTFMYSIWAKQGKEFMRNVIPCEFPTFDQANKIYIGGYNSNFAILKNAPHKEEAIRLLMYWCKPDIAEKWARLSKSPSGVKGNLTSSSFGTDAFETYSYNMEKKYGENLMTDEDRKYIFGSKNLNIPFDVTTILERKVTGKAVFKEFKRRAIMN